MEENTNTSIKNGVSFYPSFMILISVVIVSFVAYQIAILTPSTYDDCVISGVSNSREAKIAQVIVESCKSKFKSTLTEIPLNKISGLTGFGTAKQSVYSNKNDQFSADLYNGNEFVVIERLIIGIGSGTEQKNYAVNLKLNPYEKTYISIPIMPVSESGKGDWTIVKAYGTEIYHPQ